MHVVNPVMCNLITHVHNYRYSTYVYMYMYMYMPHPILNVHVHLYSIKMSSFIKHLMIYVFEKLKYLHNCFPDHSSWRGKLHPSSPCQTCFQRGTETRVSQAGEEVGVSLHSNTSVPCPKGSGVGRGGGRGWDDCCSGERNCDILECLVLSLMLYAL